jgi:glyoxylase-like metal-dependent hydrolase (beta-lactamase superfamily II)
LLLLIAWPAWSQPVSGSMNVHWAAGAADCAATPPAPLQVHAYEPQTYIIRQSACVDFEANFIYLLIGSTQALLIDTGAVAESDRMPLAATVLRLLPGEGDAKRPLLVVHTHGHADHRSGDSQFAGLHSVRVVPTDLDGLRSALGLSSWPAGLAHIELGGRTIDVLPSPGHHPAHVVFYDRRTQILFSGDFLMPGRILIDDLAAFRESAARIAEFARRHPVSYVLGGHIELDEQGNLYSFGATFHPRERALQMTSADILALPAALDEFNGFYSRHPHFVLSQPMHNLGALILAGLLALILLIWCVRRFVRRRREGKRPVAAGSP